MEIDLNRFRDAFFQEAAELIFDLESGLLRLETRPSDAALLNSVFRAVHSIKGSAGMLGFPDISRFSHVMESLLDLLRSGGLPLTSSISNLLFQATDTLKGLVEAARTGCAPPAGAGEVMARLAGATPENGAPPPGPAESRPSEGGGERIYRVRFEPGPDAFRRGVDPLLALRELSAAGRVRRTECDTSRLPDLDRLDPETCYLAWTIEVAASRGAGEIREIFDPAATGPEITVEEMAPAPVEPTPAPSAADPGLARRESSSSIRVPTDRVDKLINLVGELVIAQSIATQAAQNGSLAELERALHEIGRHTRELQERVMSVRMLPMGTVFARFPRVVRDLAAAAGKQIILETSGEDVEIDKGMVDRLSDPLTHLIRNAADHGIELPSDRINAGKPAQGLIRLRALHQGGNVLVEISDDGRGLDTGKIRRKAMERGLLRAEEALDESRIRDLIFEPGFSTATEVSEVSGRGVGMDVVRRNVESLNGSISLASRPGEGATFRLRLPLTLAIIDGLLLRAASHILVLPLAAIVESIRPDAGQIQRVAGQGEVLLLRQRPIPLLEPGRLFGFSVEDSAPGLVQLVVIVEHEGQRVGFRVDEVLGQRQVVVKSLDKHYRRVEGVLGATILGDGRVALILDVEGILKLGGARRTAGGGQPRVVDFAGCNAP